MKIIDSPWLVGRQEIADYAKVGVWTVSCMLKAGLRNVGSTRTPRTKAEWVDEFFMSNENFNTRDIYKTKPRVR